MCELKELEKPVFCMCFVCVQAKELLDHLEDVLSNKPIEVISGNTIVEAKPQVRQAAAAACSTAADLWPGALSPLLVKQLSNVGSMQHSMQHLFQ